MHSGVDHCLFSVHADSNSNADATCTVRNGCETKWLLWHIASHISLTKLKKCTPLSSFIDLECILLEQAPKNWVCEACTSSHKSGHGRQRSSLPYIDWCLWLVTRGYVLVLGPLAAELDPIQVSLIINPDTPLSCWVHSSPHIGPHIWNDVAAASIFPRSEFCCSGLYCCEVCRQPTTSFDFGY